ncbi:DUF1206 domain-containing protein [Deinococcus petrolearius]|uniref:DUF1206 domain-containing protein n=1 Tax=Deinococcus petrolearius TaxID=1751295 RepID=A0ABW1DEP1_9DEIO
MADEHEMAGTLRRAGEQAVQEAAPGLEALARFGYACRGVVYLTVGGLALTLAAGRRGGAATDTQGAVRRLEDLPLGEGLVGVLALGLVGYALWQLLRAVLDPERLGVDAGGLARRTGYLASGAVNLGAAWFAFRLVTQAGVGGGASEQDLAARVLALPAGQLLLGLGGAALLGAGIAELVSAARGKFMRFIALRGAGADHAATIRRVGQCGTAARGAVLGLVGAFVLVAAVQGEAAGVRGTGGALNWLLNRPGGAWLLGAVALGTVCYGLWCFVQARYRHIQVRPGMGAA